MTESGAHTPCMNKTAGSRRGHTYHERIREQRTECDEQATKTTADIRYLDLFGHSPGLSGCHILLWTDECWVVCRPVHLGGTCWTFSEIEIVSNDEIQGMTEKPVLLLQIYVDRTPDIPQRPSQTTSTQS